MHAYLTFVPAHPGYWVAFLHEDARTSYPRKVTVPDMLTLAKVVAKLNGSVEELQRDLKRWGQGSVKVHPSPAQVRWLNSVQRSPR